MIATINMNQKMLPIAAILTAAVLTGILSTAHMTVYADESETSTDQSLKQKNVGSGFSNNNNCAENSIESFATGEEDCRFNNNSPPVDLTSTETATETDITANPLFNLPNFDFSTGSAQ
jgi:hypothetical protein